MLMNIVFTKFLIVVITVIFFYCLYLVNNMFF